MERLRFRVNSKSRFGKPVYTRCKYLRHWLDAEMTLYDFLGKISIGAGRIRCSYKYKFREGMEQGRM
jgi:hypothetical protein